jgi:hypothetical protein
LVVLLAAVLLLVALAPAIQGSWNTWRYLNREPGYLYVYNDAGWYRLPGTFAK